MPKRPSLASSPSSSRGRIPCSNQSPTSGSTRSRTNCRTVSRIARSSSSSSASRARKSSGSSAVGFSVTATPELYLYGARMLTAVVQALALLVAGSAQAEVATLTPLEKAQAVVVAGMPAGDGFGGVLVRRWNTELARPRGALVFADQEGGQVKTFPGIAPWRAASAYRSTADAFQAGR